MNSEKKAYELGNEVLNQYPGDMVVATKNSPTGYMSIRLFLDGIRWIDDKGWIPVFAVEGVESDNAGIAKWELESTLIFVESFIDIDTMQTFYQFLLNAYENCV